MIGTLVSERYEILSEVGSGSLGTVYKAKNREDGSLVALKILQASTTEETALKRFMQGVKTARLLSHPNVVGPLDYGFIDERTPFLVTQYCEGTLLSKVLTKEGRLSLAHALDITAQVCDAIE